MKVSIILLFSIAILGLVLSGCSTSNIGGDARKAPSPDRVRCFDSDGGQNYFTAGYVEVGKKMYKDVCDNEETLTEHYCYRNKMAREQVGCDLGCDASRCLEALEIYGVVHAESSPSGVKFIMDGTNQGDTPITIVNVTPGEHDGLFILFGYENHSTTFTVFAGQQTDVWANMTPGNYPCSSFSNQPSCETQPACDWCEECDQLRYSGGLSRCVDAGTCSYTCYEGQCGAVCDDGTNHLTDNGTCFWGCNLNTCFWGSSESCAQGSMSCFDNGWVSGTVCYYDESCDGTGYTAPTIDTNMECEASVCTTSGWDNSACQIQTGDLTIDSSPRGADVYLNNTYEGETRVVINDVIAGSYPVEILSDGYLPWQATVVVEAGLMNYVFANLTLDVSTGDLTLSSTPSGASVFLDNNFLGYSPQIEEDLETGMHDVKMSSPGYQLWQGSIYVQPGVMNYLHANLTLNSTGNNS